MSKGSNVSYEKLASLKIEAELIGDQGCLVAMDALSDYTKRVSKKVQAAGLVLYELP